MIKLTNILKEIFRDPFNGDIYEGLVKTIDIETSVDVLYKRFKDLKGFNINSNKNIINPPTPLGGESSEYPTKDEFLNYCKVQGDHYGLTDEEWISIYNDFSFSGWTTLDSLGQTTRIGNWKVLSNKKAKTMSDKKRQQRASTQINGKIPRAIEA